MSSYACPGCGHDAPLAFACPRCEGPTMSGPAEAIKALLLRLEATRAAYVKEIDEHQESVRLALGDRAVAYVETKGLTALRAEKVEELRSIRAMLGVGPDEMLLTTAELVRRRLTELRGKAGVNRTEVGRIIVDLRNEANALRDRAEKAERQLALTTPCTRGDDERME